MRRPPHHTLPANSLGARRPNASVCAVAWVITHPEARSPAVRALLVLAQHMDKHGSAFPGLDRIARFGGMSRRTAQRAIAALVEHPEAPITRKQRRNTSSMYALTTAAYDAPDRANQVVKAHDTATPAGVTAGAAEGDTPDTATTPTVARPLGVTGGALTLRNLHLPANSRATDNGNGAVSREGYEASERTSSLRVPTAARQTTPPRARGGACDVVGCCRAAVVAKAGRMFCETHAPSDQPSFWTSSGGRL
jgi:hypothetical protein